MKVSQAIELLSYSSEQNTILITGDDKDALKLGIEALKRLEQNRTLHFIPSLKLLEGETLEEEVENENR